MPGLQQARRTLTLWTRHRHRAASLDGQHLKTLPSGITSTDLDRLRAQDARLTGPPPARPSWASLATGTRNGEQLT